MVKSIGLFSDAQPRRAFFPLDNSTPSQPRKTYGTQKNRKSYMTLLLRRILHLKFCVIKILLIMPDIQPVENDHRQSTPRLDLYLASPQMICSRLFPTLCLGEIGKT
jgi:hypothetical protein